MAAIPHAPGFLALVNSVKPEIREIPADELRGELEARRSAALIDVREESEFAAGHVQGAEHLSRGIIERDIEAKHPDKKQPLYLYCGGGFRSALAAHNLQQMGYTQVTSVDGGWKALKELLPTT